MISTGDFARAIFDFYPATAEDVAEWCEEGLLKARKNPSRKLVRPKWNIVPADVPRFLLEELKFEASELKTTCRRLKIPFKTPLSLVA